MSDNKIRAQQITLDLPTELAEVWVRATLQTVIKDADYNTAQTIDRTEFIHRKFSEFATEFVSVVDPLTGATLNVSGVALAFAVSAFVKAWILADVPGTAENQHGDIIKE